MTARTIVDGATCTVCGKELSGSAQWGPEWLVSRYCSESCSEKRLAALDYRLQEAILQLLGGQANGDSLTAAEVARFVDPLGWESLMERTHSAARRLAAKGALSISGPDSKDTLLWGRHGMRLRLPN